MSETSDILPSGAEADLQEQGNSVSSGGSVPGPDIGGGSGGSEADLQEQAVSVDAADAELDTGIPGEGTGGSEADRLEQAADVPLDADDAFPRGATDDDPAA